MKKYIFSGILLILIVFLFIGIRGCEISYDKIELLRKNPTEYTFYVSISQAKSIIERSKIKIDRVLQGEAFKLYSVDKDSLRLSRFLSLYTNNLNDYVYKNYHGSSIIYMSADNKIDYNASFYLHLDSLNKDNTKISIHTIDPRIFVKVRSLINHAPGFFNTYNVEPSTIEEYKILLVIGEALGIKEEMPPLILPE